MRLDKVLELNKVGSRKTVRRHLLTGNVTVNGLVVREGSMTVDPGIDCVVSSGHRMNGPRHSYYMLNKPIGVVTAVTDSEHLTVIDLLSQRGIKTDGLFPVGRLDRDTEGLIFLTTNGQLAYQLAMAKQKVQKVYQVTVNGLLTAETVAAFQRGVRFADGTLCRPAELIIQKSSEHESHAHVTIDEGKFHQVKKMFLANGVKVTALKRLAIGPLTLDRKLSPGAFRELRADELASLHPYFNPSKGNN